MPGPRSAPATTAATTAAAAAAGAAMVVCKSPETAMVTGAAKEIHNSGDWRQGTRAGSHEKSSDYAQRVMTDMPLHDALVRSQVLQLHRSNAHFSA